MSLWSCDDYQINKVSYNVNATYSTSISYVVEVQRLPAENYPNITFVSIDGGVIPDGTADSALLGLIAPQVNSELTTMDAAFDASDTSSTGSAVVGDWTYTEKTGL